MRYRIILDLAVYMVAPILLLNFVNANYLMYYIIALIGLGIFYSALTKYKEIRVNISGIVFMALCLALFLFKKEAESEFQVYVYDTYFLILCSLAIPALNIFGKNIFNRIYVDFLRAKGHNSLVIWSGIRKNKLDIEFNKLSSLVAIHLLIISFIKVYSISTYGESKYLATSDLEILVSMIFILGEMFMISKIISKSKYKVNNHKNNRNFNSKEKSKNRINEKTKRKINDGRVINLSQYKNINK